MYLRIFHSFCQQQHLETKSKTGLDWAACILNLLSTHTNSFRPIWVKPLQVYLQRCLRSHSGSREARSGGFGLTLVTGALCTEEHPRAPGGSGSFQGPPAAGTSRSRLSTAAGTAPDIAAAANCSFPACSSTLQPITALPRLRARGVQQRQHWEMQSVLL